MIEKSEKEDTRHWVDICQAGACSACGSEELLDYAKKHLDAKQYLVRSSACLGHCGLGPNIGVNLQLVTGITTKNLAKEVQAIAPRNTKRPNLDNGPDMSKYEELLKNLKF